MTNKELHRKRFWSYLSLFNFYRGSALLFYQNLKIDQDKWIHSHYAADYILIHVNTLQFL
jgi:uncharacterized protein (DUF2252 family)